MLRARNPLEWNGFLPFKSTPRRKSSADTSLSCWVSAEGGRRFFTRFKDLGVAATLSAFHRLTLPQIWPQLWPIHLSHLHLTHTVLPLHRDPFIIQCPEKLYPISPSTNHFEVKVKVRLRIHLICEASLDHLVWEAQGHLSLCPALLWHGHYRHVLKHLSLPLNWQS